MTKRTDSPRTRKPRRAGTEAAPTPAPDQVLTVEIPAHLARGVTACAFVDRMSPEEWIVDQVRSYVASSFEQFAFDFGEPGMRIAARKARG